MVWSIGRIVTYALPSMYQMLLNVRDSLHGCLRTIFLCSYLMWFIVTPSLSPSCWNLLFAMPPNGKANATDEAQRVSG